MQHTTVYKQKKNPATLFEIHPLHWLAPGEDEPEKVHSNHHFEIIWVVTGSGNQWIDLEKKDIENNRLFFVKPGQMHRFQPATDMSGYVIHFSESFLGMEDQNADPTYYNCLFRMFADPRGTAIRIDMLEDLTSLIERMMREFNNVHLFRMEILRRYFKIFLLYLTRQFEGSFQTTHQTRTMELVQKFMSLLEKKFRTHKMVADYANDLLVTPNYLNEIIKKMTGHSAGYHIRQRVVLEAKRQGRYSDSCMKEIAYSLGFSDSAHFSKFFKTVTGTNFTEFKKEKLVVAFSA